MKSIAYSVLNDKELKDQEKLDLLTSFTSHAINQLKNSSNNHSSKKLKNYISWLKKEINKIKKEL